MLGKIKHISLFLGLLLLTRCANVVAPTGGPKDVTPPKVVEAKPENRSTNFNNKKIELTFDEYLTLNNATQEVLVSPLLTIKPDVKLNGKTVTVKFHEALKPDATYTIDFGNAIQDLHEGNILKNYTYIFSTGDILDTLSIYGKIINADDEKPADDMFVALYDEDSDSLHHQPLHRAPDFITRTDKEGNFRFKGLPEKCFLVFAFTDVNANYYFDMPNEKVAFIDSLVSPLDSVSLLMKAFVEIDTNQMLLEKKLVEEGLLRFVFRHPAHNVRFTFPEHTVDSFKMVKVWSQEKDTLCCYFTPNVIDSMQVIINYDTLINDSTRYSLKFRETKQKQGKRDHFMRVTSNLRGKLLTPGDDFILRFSEPVIKVIPYDTLAFEKLDEFGMKYGLSIDMNDTLEYTINLPDSVFFSVRGKVNDTLSFKFTQASETNFGNIAIQVAPPEGVQAIVQLLDSHSKVVEQYVIDTLQRLEFLRLNPEKYKLRAIIDADRNGKWSTGNYHRRFLPEPILFYKDELDVKAGWDIDLDEVWKLH